MARTNNLTNFLTDVADSIRSKTGKSELIACEDFDTEIESIETGGASNSMDGVYFYDYDGTLLYQYTVKNFLRLNTMPQNPTHNNLISQGWNWDLETAKDYVSTYGILEVGQMYNTLDGNTQIHIEIPYDNCTVYLGGVMGNGGSGGGTITIDCGDGDTIVFNRRYNDTSIPTPQQHTYEKKGSYTIRYIFDNITNGRIRGVWNSSLSSTRIIGNNSSDNVSEHNYANMITGINLSPDITILENASFAYCHNVQYITFSKGLTTIEHLSFKDWNIPCLALPDTLTTLGTYSITASYAGVFSNGFKHIIIPQSLEIMHYWVFYNLNYLYLDTLNLPKSLTTLENSWYTGSTSGTNVTPPIKYSNNATVTLPEPTNFLPNRTLHYVSNAKQITNLSDVLEKIGTINANMFENFVNLETVEIPDNLITTLNNYTFTNCHSLKEITIPNSVTNIGGYCFQSCYNLQNIIIPNSVTTLGVSCFQYCTSLRNITLSDKLTAIPNSCFQNCISLETIEIPSSVNSIGNSCFEKCTSLKNVIIPNSVTVIGTYCFQYCSNLQYVRFPSSIPNIPSYCFSWARVNIYDFTQCSSVVTLGSTNNITVRTSTKIVVPDSLYDDWVAATGWSTFASNIVKESEINY